MKSTRLCLGRGKAFMPLPHVPRQCYYLIESFGLTETCAISGIDGRDLSENGAIHLQDRPKIVCFWHT